MTPAYAGPEIAAAYAIAHSIDPADLTPAERFLLAHTADYWLRPDQRLPVGDWRYCGAIAGRGFGKTTGFGAEINRRVIAGLETNIGLGAPTDDRVRDVQVRMLIETAPPWCKPVAWRGGAKWPNGVTAIPFTPEAPGRARGENLSLTWLTEIVDWNPSTRWAMFANITTATRVGRAQVLWDTTSLGKNDVVQYLERLNAENPARYPILRGTVFDNPALPSAYLLAECAKYTGRRFREELLGEVFAESSGALWRQAWLDEHRVAETPAGALRIVSVDPALSARVDADETGAIVLASKGGHVYLEDDLSGRLTPDQWGDLVIDAHLRRGATGAIVERNHLGDNALYVIRSRAATHNLAVRVLPADRAFPTRTAGVIYVREMVAASSKTSRASGPAAETEAGRVHCVGELPELELELCTYEPGVRKSPNRYDAAVYGIAELQGLTSQRGSDARLASVNGESARDAHATLRARLANAPRRSL